MPDHEHRNAIMPAKHEAYRALMRSLRDPCTYHRRPTERLAANICANLICRRRHTPEQLQQVLDCVNELRSRLISAKV